MICLFKSTILFILPLNGPSKPAHWFLPVLKTMYDIFKNINIPYNPGEFSFRDKSQTKLLLDGGKQ